MRSVNSKISIVLALLLIAQCSSEESTEEPVITSVSNSTQLWSNGTREGRGLLETIQTVVQTVQGVNKLFGNTGGTSSNKEINYKNPNFQAQNGFHHGSSNAGNVGNYGNFHTSNNYQAAQQLQQLGLVQQPQGAQGAAFGSNLYPNYNGIVPGGQGYHQANPNVIGSHNNNEYYGSSAAAQVQQSLGSHAEVNYNQYYPGGYQQHAPVRDSSIGIQSGGISKQGYIPGSGGFPNSVLAGGGSPFGGSGALQSGVTSSFGGGAGFPGGSFLGGGVPGGSGVPSGALNPNFGSISGGSRPTFGGLASLLNGGASGLGGGNGGVSGLASLLNGGTSGGSGSAIASLLGGAASSLLGAGASNAAAAGSGGSSALLSGLNELGILNDLGDVLSIRNVEKLLGNVNKFDALKCIPRMVCETIAKRQQEAEKQDSAKSTTTTTTRRPKHKKRSDEGRGGRFIPGLKIQGVDTALEQFVKFLELTQLKDWSLYPYLQGAYYGNQVRSSEECSDRFSSCPFTEEQLLYYFNNYNGGLFQHFRSDRSNDGD